MKLEIPLKRPMCPVDHTLPMTALDELSEHNLRSLEVSTILYVVLCKDAIFFAPASLVKQTELFNL